MHTNESDWMPYPTHTPTTVGFYKTRATEISKVHFRYWTGKYWCVLALKYEMKVPASTVLGATIRETNTILKVTHWKGILA